MRKDTMTDLLHSPFECSCGDAFGELFLEDEVDDEGGDDDDDESCEEESEVGFVLGLDGYGCEAEWEGLFFG